MDNRQRIIIIGAASLGVEVARALAADHEVVVVEDLDRTDSREGALDLDRTSVCEADIRDLFARELRRDPVMEIRCVKEEPMDFPLLPFADRGRHTHPHSARDLRRAERGRGGRR